MTSRPTQTMCLVVAAVALGASLAARSAETQQAGPTPQERVAALKQSMQESQTKLRQYEWTETTIISLKGEEKARTQKRCSYGADGKLQKVPIDSPDQAEDAVALAVQLGTLADGTSYTAQTTLDAAAKKIRVVIQNAGHHPRAR